VQRVIPRTSPHASIADSLRRLGCTDKQVQRHVKQINQVRQRRLEFQTLRAQEQSKQGTYWWHWPVRETGG
jgi:hypothetical protein